MERVKGYGRIDTMAWSHDGRFIAYSTWHAYLYVKKVLRSRENRDEWDLGLELQKFHLPGLIQKLIFHPQGHLVLVITTNSLITVDIAERRLALSVPFNFSFNSRWISHPTSPNYFLGCSPTGVQAFSWNSLKPVATYTYSLPPSAYTTADGAFGSVDRVLYYPESPQILLQVHEFPGWVPQYVLIDGGDMQLSTETEDFVQPYETRIACTVLPPDIVSAIREPLALLSRGRLAFLDVHGWICTWSLPPSPPGPSLTSGKRPLGLPGQRENGIIQYYVLPGDWATGEDTRMCAVTRDGTFLCPRGGGVVAVQCPRLGQ